MIPGVAAPITPDVSQPTGQKPHVGGPPHKPEFTGGFAPGPRIVNFRKVSSDCKLPHDALVQEDYCQMCGDDGRCLSELHKIIRLADYRDPAVT